MNFNYLKKAILKLKLILNKFQVIAWLIQGEKKDPIFQNIINTKMWQFSYYTSIFLF